MELKFRVIKNIKAKENFVIIEAGNDKPLFWNNETGFGSFETADIFTLKETKEYHLPVHGKWVKLSYAKKLVAKHKHNGEALAYIKSVSSLDTGGHIIVDAVELTDKTVLIIDEELVCQYSSLDAFLEGENSLHCIERRKPCLDKTQ